MVYLDDAATTKPHPEVIKSMLPYFTDKWFNPSSLYSEANKVKKDIESAQKVISNFINAKPDEIYFTSGGSESNCWAIQGFIQNSITKRRTPIIITSTIEHKSVLSCVKGTGVDAHYIGVNEKGEIDLIALRDMLEYVSSQTDNNRDILVSIQYANNEIGTIQDIPMIAEIVHKYGAIFHTDAVQAFGHIPINVETFGIDMMSASGHKINTPKGIGFIYIKSGIEIKPLIYGSQNNGMRGGTENVPYIIGLAKAVEINKSNLKNRMMYLAQMRDYMISRLITEFDCKVNGLKTDRLSNNINVTFPNNITGEALIYMLDTCGVYISAGSACNSHSNVPSYVLLACGLSQSDAYRTIRITLPENITQDEIDFTLLELKKQIQILDFES